MVRVNVSRTATVPLDDPRDIAPWTRPPAVAPAAVAMAGARPAGAFEVEGRTPLALSDVLGHVSNPKYITFGCDLIHHAFRSGALAASMGAGGGPGTAAGAAALIAGVDAVRLSYTGRLVAWEPYRAFVWAARGGDGAGAAGGRATICCEIENTQGVATCSMAFRLRQSASARGAAKL